MASPFHFENTKSNPTNNDLVADLRRVANHLGTSHVPQNTYRKLGAYSSTVMKTRFGSWNKALAAAGLVTQHRSDLTTEELLDNIIAVWAALGRQPRKREMTKPLSKFTADPYITRFGGWLPAMRAFVEYANADSKVIPDNHPTRRVISRGSRDPSLRLRFRVMLRDHFRCRNCGRSPATQLGLVLHVDHIEPWANGGATTYENLQTLCSDCNLGKSDLSPI